MILSRLSWATLLLSGVIAVAVAADSSAAPSDDNALDVIMRQVEAEKKAEEATKQGQLRGGEADGRGPLSRNPIDMIREAIADAEQEDEDEEEVVDAGEPDPVVDSFFAEFSSDEEVSDEEAEEDVTDLPKEVETAIERHIQQQVARELVDMEDAQRKLEYETPGPEGCEAPAVPSQNATCVEIIEAAFEKDFVKIARKKEQKIYAAQLKFDEEVAKISTKLTSSLDDDALALRCDFEQASALNDYTDYRNCVKKAVRRSQAQAKLHKKAAKKRRKKRVKKQIAIFEKKQNKLMKLRTMLLPRCNICVEQLDPNSLVGYTPPPPPSLVY